MTLDLPLPEAFRMGNHFVSAFSQKDFSSLFLIGSYIWKARGLDSDNIEFTVSEEGQIVDKFVVPPNRRSCWVDALKEIIKEASHKVGEIPTVSASSY
ncbi:MAG: hypothetical protein ICV63_21810 [Coleofasciculus sp. Co-bin14]|nr:hypothetical protein [Coleofasciculus sp. Co-bin14]